MIEEIRKHIWKLKDATVVTKSSGEWFRATISSSTPLVTYSKVHIPDPVITNLNLLPVHFKHPTHQPPPPIFPVTSLLYPKICPTKTTITGSTTFDCLSPPHVLTFLLNQFRFEVHLFNHVLASIPSPPFCSVFLTKPSISNCASILRSPLLTGENHTARLAGLT